MSQQFDFHKFLSFLAEQTLTDDNEQEFRQLHHAADTARLLEQTVEPFQSQLDKDIGCSSGHACEYIERAAETAEQRAVNIVDVRGDELFLLGAPRHTKTASAPPAALIASTTCCVSLEVAVMRAGKHESRKFRTQICAGLFCDTGLAPSRKRRMFSLAIAAQRSSANSMPEHGPAGLAENFCGVDNADAVRQHKGGVIYDAHELRVTAAEINDFRVRRYNITLLPRAGLLIASSTACFFVTAWNCTPKIEAVFILLFSYVNTSSSGTAHNPLYYNAVYIKITSADPANHRFDEKNRKSETKPDFLF